MSARVALVLSVLLSLFLTGAARADKRVALVIGNAAYEAVPKLTTPENDAAAIGQMLKAAEFDVSIEVNLTTAGMQRAMRDFSARTTDADMVVVFFSGHGIDIGGTNYLIPVDATLKRDVDAADEAVLLDSLVTLVRPGKKLGLVILDASRDNPFASTKVHTSAGRPVERHSAKVDTSRGNLLIAYAAKAGTVAHEDHGTYSHFTRALLDHLTTPGLDIRLAFGRAIDAVLKATDNRQRPFVYGALDGGQRSLVEPLIPRR